jgi:hypothetical protein
MFFNQNSSETFVIENVNLQHFNVRIRKRGELVNMNKKLNVSEASNHLSSRNIIKIASSVNSATRINNVTAV